VKRRHSGFLAIVEYEHAAGRKTVAKLAKKAPCERWQIRQVIRS
jgi:hypothetical protein